MSPGKDFYGRSPLGWGRAGIILLSFWFSGHWMQAFFCTFVDGFRALWGGYPLRGHFLGSSCARGPPGGAKVAFDVLLGRFWVPFWEPQWRSSRYFRRFLFPVFLFGAVQGGLLDGFRHTFGRCFGVRPLRYQSHILGGQICSF